MSESTKVIVVVRHYDDTESEVVVNRSLGWKEDQASGLIFFMPGSAGSRLVFPWRSVKNYRVFTEKEQAARDLTENIRYGIRAHSNGRQDAYAVVDMDTGEESIPLSMKVAIRCATIENGRLINGLPVSEHFPRFFPRVAESSAETDPLSEDTDHEYPWG